jgi:hypothetical protein
MHMGRTRMDEIADLATRLRDSGPIEIPNKSSAYDFCPCPIDQKDSTFFCLGAVGVISSVGIGLWCGCAIASEKRNSQANGSSKGTKFAEDIYRTTCQMHLGGMK